MGQNMGRQRPVQAEAGDRGQVEGARCPDEGDIMRMEP
jgi:hypothetical protein